MTGTETLKRLTAGPILANMVSNMDAKVNGMENRKLFFYSGHDLTLANILNTIGAYDLHWPTFSASLMFELSYKNSSQEYIFQV